MRISDWSSDVCSSDLKAGIPSQLEGCHTTLIDGYVVDGHVPVNIVRKLLRDRPDIVGITLPGMPTGSPGMGGEKTAPFTVFSVPKNGERSGDRKSTRLNSSH